MFHAFCETITSVRYNLSRIGPNAAVFTENPTVREGEVLFFWLSHCPGLLCSIVLSRGVCLYVAVRSSVERT